MQADLSISFFQPCRFRTDAGQFLRRTDAFRLPPPAPHLRSLDRCAPAGRLRIPPVGRLEYPVGTDPIRGEAAGGASCFFLLYHILGC